MAAPEDCCCSFGQLRSCRDHCLAYHCRRWWGYASLASSAGRASLHLQAPWTGSGWRGYSYGGFGESTRPSTLPPA